MESVGPGYVVLKRALPYAVDLNWQPELYTLGPVVSQSGYEDFTVQFKWGACGGWAGGRKHVPVLAGVRPVSCEPWRPPPIPPSADNYTGHQEAKGYNGIQIENCRNCWARRLRMIDCDNVVNVVASESTTVRWGREARRM